MNDAKNQTANACRICGAGTKEPFTAREMMFGTRDEFQYVECTDCGCVQITEVPANLGDYYPPDYYSYSPSRKRVRPLKKYLRAARARYAIERKGLLWKMIFPAHKLDPLLKIYGDIGVRLDDRVLDVGGGGGGHVWLLMSAGLKNALAIDPFIEADVEIDGIPLARKSTIFDYDGEADFVVFHHSFEHMDDQLGVLTRSREILSPHGRVLLRIPTVSSEAWDTYGADWSSLDAPRHLYLHSNKSIQALAVSAGFEVTRMWCDSNAFQFWGSEQYRQDIPLNDSRSYNKNPAGSIFTDAEISAYNSRSDEANKAMRGDSLCVLLTPGARP